MAQSSVDAGRPLLQVRGRVPTNDKFVGAKIVYEDALGNDGVIWFTETSIPTDGSLTEETAGEGLPKGAVIKEGEVYLVQATSTPLQRGACAVRLSAGDHTITQGYLWQGRWAVDMLNPEVLGPTGGHGNMREIITANPAAAAEVVGSTVPADAIWRPHSMTVELAQGATQTPRPALRIILVDTTQPLDIPMSADLAASTTLDLTWARGLNDTINNVTGGTMTQAVPEILLVEGALFGSTLTQGIGAATDYTAAQILVEEWLVI